MQSVEEEKAVILAQRKGGFTSELTNPQPPLLPPGYTQTHRLVSHTPAPIQTHQHMLCTHNIYALDQACPLTVAILLLLFSHQSRPTLCNPMDCSMPGFPFPHHLPEFAQVHVIMPNNRYHL